MDGRRVEALARRAAARLLVGGALAGVTALRGGGGAAAGAGCVKLRNRCNHDSQCCTRRCRRGRCRR